ncbi:MAG: DUF3466 family protein [Tepidisphaeraceae bacterium]
MSRIAPVSRIVLASALGLTAVASQSASAADSFFRIPTLGGTTFQSTSAQRLVAINADGAVVGGSNAGSNPRAYYLAPGSTTPVDLGIASNSPAGAWANGYGINNAGQAVGRVEVTSYSNYRSFVVTPGGSLSILDQANVPSSTQSAAYDINNNGVIVGNVSYTYLSNGLTMTTTQGYAYLNNTMYALGSLAGTNSSSNATAINDSNTIVGTTNVASGTRTFTYTVASSGTGTMTALPTLGGTSASGFGINNNGDTVGWSTTAGGTRHAFFVAAGSSTAVDLNPTSVRAEAYDVNNLGQAVGYDYFAGGTQLAALWQNGSAIDLNAYYHANVPGQIASYTLTAAYGINDAGQIVGVGTDSATNSTFNFTMSVPEPSSLALLGLGAAAMLRRRVK